MELREDRMAVASPRAAPITALVHDEVARLEPGRRQQFRLRHRW
jgi:hypothetical protein